MIQKAERIIEAYQKVKPAGCGVIAVDGRAAAGKTTFAEELAVTLGGAVVHMDDFFLPGELRTPERLAAPGGNVHAERFAEEVLPFLRRGAAFRSPLRAVRPRRRAQSSARLFSAIFSGERVKNPLQFASKVL